MRLSDAELQWMQTRLAQRYAAAGREAQETLEALYDEWTETADTLQNSAQ